MKYFFDTIYPNPNAMKNIKTTPPSIGKPGGGGGVGGGGVPSAKIICGAKHPSKIKTIFCNVVFIWGKSIKNSILSKEKNFILNIN